MFGKSPPLFILLGVCMSAQAQDVTEYVEVRPGTLPIILTIPHGGGLQPPGIMARRYGIIAQDTNTVELGLTLLEEMQSLYGGSPHAVICRLHRAKVDCNRDLPEAAQGDPVATATWQRFHQATTDLRQKITDESGAGLALDLHGHRHEQPLIELGYLIPGPELNTTNASLDKDLRLQKMSSIRELAQRTPQPFSQLLRGARSLGGLLDSYGYQSIPSPAHPSPGTATYFSGVYDILTHGSRDQGSISAIQVECPWAGVRDTPNNQRRFAKTLAKALGEYFELHFQRQLAAPQTEE